MSIDGQGHFFTIYFPGFVCFVLYLAKIAGERLQDHWSSGFQIVMLFHSQVLPCDSNLCTQIRCTMKYSAIKKDTYFGKKGQLMVSFNADYAAFTPSTICYECHD